MPPVFSVVLPVHNRADTVGRSVVSVLAQTFASLELIVVDAASHDGTISAVQLVADRRVRVLEAARSRDAPRVGKSAARGTFVTVIDADTVARPHWLARVARLARPDGPGAERMPAGAVDEVACGGIQHHADHSGTDVDADALSTRPGAVVRRRVPSGSGRSVSTPEALVEWFEPVPGQPVSRDELQLGWANDAIATLGSSPIPSADLLSRYATVGGLAAARLHRHGEARRLFGIARQLNRTDPRCWARWVVASLPPLSDLVWAEEPVEGLARVEGLAGATR